MLNALNGVLAVCLLNLTFILPAQAGSHRHQVLASPGMALLTKAEYIRPLAPKTVMHLSIALKLRNQTQLDNLVNALYTPHSPDYQKFLNHRQIEERYLPTAAVEQQVRDYFIAQGLQAHIANHAVQITGTAEQIEKVFKVKMNAYRYQNRIGYANAQAPVLNRDVAQHIAQITGLNTLLHYQTHSIALKPTKTKLHDLNFAWNSFTPAAQPTTRSIGTGFTGTQLRTAYNMVNIPPISGTTIDGTGQTIVLYLWCGTQTPAQIMSDANVYNARNGLKLFTAANFAVLNPNGTPFTQCATPADVDGEIALDIQSAHTLAPGAKIVYVLAQDNSLVTLDQGLATLLPLLPNSLPNGFSNAYVVSNSWGTSEDAGPFNAPEVVFQLAAARGISLTFSTGDCGDEMYLSNACPDTPSVTPRVNYPASSAYVSAVGGTSLFVDNTWNYAFETNWGTYENNAFVFGGGGGISSVINSVLWQTTTINNYTAGGYSLGTVGQYNQRALPDISMLGDPITGLNVVLQGQTVVIGGTSLASPLLAGTLTLVNQARTLLNRGSPIGFLSPYLYTQNNTLRSARAINPIVGPHRIISGASLPPVGAPISAFTINTVTFNWNSSLTTEPEQQFWNDGVGVGSPNVPYFITALANL